MEYGSTSRRRLASFQDGPGRPGSSSRLPERRSAFRFDFNPVIGAARLGAFSIHLAWFLDSGRCAHHHPAAGIPSGKLAMRSLKIMPRKALIAANWKMYKTPAEAKAFVDAFLPLVAGHTRDEIALFPSPVLLPAVIAAAKGSNVAVGAQNIHFAEEGAYTGETSVGQLLAVGGTHTLIGHSERRQYFAETDDRSR